MSTRRVAGLLASVWKGPNPHPLVGEGSVFFLQPVCMHVLVCKHIFIYLCTFPRDLKKMFLTMKIKQIIASLGCESKGNRSSWHELFRKEMVIVCF